MNDDTPVQTLKNLFIEGAKKDLQTKKERSAKMFEMMEADVAKVEKMTDIEFEAHFFNVVKPAINDVQFLAGRFEPADQAPPAGQPA